MLGGWIVGCQGSTMNNCLFFLLSAFEDQRKFVQFRKKEIRKEYKATYKETAKDS
jgi:hypothetical protein